MPVDINQIGSINRDLVLALKNGQAYAAGYLVSEYRHPQGFHYDLSYGLHAIWNKYMLKGTYIGTKYYCYNKFGIDMAKRIVHIHDPSNPGSPQSFYRLIHTGGDPNLRDNSYRSCEEITGV